ncbi:MAG: PEGA domain-containing protein, partial [Deltaproteobacteria bacterium]|nr:PEGA domain-containing protein [Deltaproteobacteria bacterium]
MSVTGKEPEKKPARVPPAPATIPLIALTLLSGMLCSGSALAAGGSGARRVAVLGLEGADLPPRLPVQTTAAVRREITGFPDLILVAKDAVTLSEAALTFACIDESTACMAQIGLELGAQLLLYGRMKPYREGQAHLVLHAIDVEERREIASEEGIFELSQLEDGAARLCTQLLARRGASPQARLVLNILQAGARIYLDGRPVDQAPLAMPLLAEPGLHEVKVVHEGFEEYRETIEVRGGETVRREIDLRPLPEEYPPPPTLPAEAIAPPTPPVRSWGMRISTARLAGWGLLGGGALVAAVGGTFSVLTLQTQRQ